MKSVVFDDCLELSWYKAVRWAVLSLGADGHKQRLVQPRLQPMILSGLLSRPAEDTDFLLYIVIEETHVTRLVLWL